MKSKNKPNIKLIHDYMKQKNILNNCCIDIDGVLCRDVTQEEDNNERKYINFLLNAELILKLEYKVKFIVTSRLEKYRKYTEEWLSKQNIQYDKLIMMDLPDKDIKKKFGNPAKFKADFYKKSECSLFIESSKREAKRIFKLTNKSVICTENMKLYNRDSNKFRNLLIFSKNLLAFKKK